jgi:hypothetical protein
VYFEASAQWDAWTEPFDLAEVAPPAFVRRDGRIGARYAELEGRAVVKKAAQMEAVGKKVVAALGQLLGEVQRGPAGVGLKAAFSYFDRDRSGTISPAELRDGLAGLGCPLTEEQLAAVTDRLDKDGDGEIDVGEFIGRFAPVAGATADAADADMKARMTEFEGRENYLPTAAFGGRRAGYVFRSGYLGVGCGLAGGGAVAPSCATRRSVGNR